MKRLLGTIIIFLSLAILPQVIGSYYVRLLTLMLILSIFAMSLDLLVGFLNLPSVGHAAYFGTAAYIIGIFSKMVMDSFWVNLALALVCPTILAAIFALLVLRTRGAYYFIITVALAQMLWGIAMNWRSVTGGDDGLPGIARPDLNFLPWSLIGTTDYFYFVLFFFLLSSIAMYIIVQSPFGHVIVGIRENEQHMRALGYNTWLYKYLVHIIAGFFAALSGMLSVYYTGFVDPSDLNIRLSSTGLLMVLLGGSGTLIGPAVGAGVIVLLENLISAYTDRWLIILGLLYVFVVMFAPGGILGIVKQMRLKKALWYWRR